VNVAEVGILVAFAAGVLGFLSPCIVPLIPGYISFVSGVALHDLDPRERRRHLARVLAATALFVLGFALVFTALGASASLVGGFVLTNRVWLSRVGGIVVLLLGMAVLARAPFLLRERRIHLTRRPVGLVGAIPVGMAFGFAWTPCVGPVLAAVLTLAATQQDAATGATLLFAYALGLGLPFLVAATALVLAFDTLGVLRRLTGPMTALSGAFLVVMGLALVTDLMYTVNTWLFRLLPFRPAL